MMTVLGDGMEGDFLQTTSFPNPINPLSFLGLLA